MVPNRTDLSTRGSNSSIVVPLTYGSFAFTTTATPELGYHRHHAQQWSMMDGMGSASSPLSLAIKLSVTACDCSAGQDCCRRVIIPLVHDVGCTERRSTLGLEGRVSSTTPRVLGDCCVEEVSEALPTRTHVGIARALKEGADHRSPKSCVVPFYTETTPLKTCNPSEWQCTGQDLQPTRPSGLLSGASSLKNEHTCTGVAEVQTSQPTYSWSGFRTTVRPLTGATASTARGNATMYPTWSGRGQRPTQTVGPLISGSTRLRMSPWILYCVATMLLTMLRPS